MQKSQIRLIVCFFILCLLLAGCNGGKETDEIAWVISIGVDKAGDELEITYRVAISRALAGEMAGGGDKKPTTLVTVRAPSLAEGRNLLNTSLARSVSLNQVRLFVISEDLARTGLDDLIGPLIRFREFRGSIFIMVARGNAREMFEKNAPSLETLSSRWIENYIQSSNEVSYYPKANLHEFYLRLKNSTGSPYALYVGLNPLTGHGQPSGSKAEGEAAEQYLPGDTPRIGGDPVEVLGTAVFKGAKMVGALDTEGTRAFVTLQNQLYRNFLVIEDPLAPKHKINIAVRNGSKPKIKIANLGERPTINIDVFLEGEITAIPSGIMYEKTEYRSLLEQQVSNVMKNQLQNMLAKTQEWGADIADFGYYSRGNFSTLQELQEYKWNSHYPQAEFIINVRTELRRSGLMQQTEPIRRD